MSSTPTMQGFEPEEIIADQSGDLPNGWVWTRLGESGLLEIQTGFACAKNRAVENGVLHLRPYNITLNGELDLSEKIFIPEDYQPNLELYYLKPGDVIFNNTNSLELLGKSVLVRQPLNCVFSNHLTRLRIKDKNKLEPQWLLLCLRQMWQASLFAQKANIWIGQAGYNTTMLTALYIPLPPVQTQQRIVARLEGLLAEVRSMRQNLADTRAILDRVMKAALEQVFNNTKIIAFKQLSLICDIDMGQSPSGDSYSNEPVGIPLLNGPTEFGKEHPTPIQWTKEYTRLCKIDDLLLCVRGATTGRTNWADQVYCIGRGIAAIRPKNKQVTDIKYVAHFINSQTSKILEAGRGSTFPNVSKQVLNNWLLPDIDFSTQKQIVAHLDYIQSKVNEMRLAVAEDEERLAQAEAGLLRQAFKGEL